MSSFEPAPVSWPAGALSSGVFGLAFQDPGVADLLSDERYLQGLLRFEAMLAVVQGELSIIPTDAAERIQHVCTTLKVDPERLAAGVRRDGMPMIALVAVLREAVGSEFGAYVHWGATSQDAMDTALVLQLRPAVARIEQTLLQVVQQLAQLAREHRSTVMVARTHGQQAVPTSFGLKVAGWLSPLLKHQERLSQMSERLWQLQLGGAAGTLASLGAQAPAVRLKLAQALDLELGDLPWHSQRDSLAELGGWLSLVCGGLGKITQDIVLLSQSEVLEVLEAAPGVRGGSSCMPQKNNPMRCEQVLAAARTVASQLGALHGSLVQEHERATHGWQVEWLNLPQMVALTAGALSNVSAVFKDLQVQPERMLANLKNNHSLALAESAVGALSHWLSRPEAQRRVRECAHCAIAEGRSLLDVLRDSLDTDQITHQLNWSRLSDPVHALGQAPQFVDAVLARVPESARA